MSEWLFAGEGASGMSIPLDILRELLGDDGYFFQCPFCASYAGISRERRELFPEVICGACSNFYFYDTKRGKVIMPINSTVLEKDNGIIIYEGFPE